MEISALYLSNLLEDDSARKHFSPQNVHSEAIHSILIQIFLFLMRNKNLDIGTLGKPLKEWPSLSEYAKVKSA